MTRHPAVRRWVDWYGDWCPGEWPRPGHETRDLVAVRGSGDEVVLCAECAAVSGDRIIPAPIPKPRTTPANQQLTLEDS